MGPPAALVVWAVVVWAVEVEGSEEVLLGSVEAAPASVVSGAVLVVSVPEAVASPEVAGGAELVGSVAAGVSAGAEVSEVGAGEAVDGAAPAPEPEAAAEPPPGDGLAVDEGLVPGSDPDGAD